MSKNSGSKKNEFEKINIIKDKIKNSKTLNLSLINKNMIRSNNNSEKNLIKLNCKNDNKINDIIDPMILSNKINHIINKSIILDSNQNEKEIKDSKLTKEINKFETDIIKESDLLIYNKNNTNFIKDSNIFSNTDRFSESDPHR